MRRVPCVATVEWVLSNSIARQADRVSGGGAHRPADRCAMRARPMAGPAFRVVLDISTPVCRPRASVGYAP